MIKQTCFNNWLFKFMEDFIYLNYLLNRDPYFYCEFNFAIFGMDLKKIKHIKIDVLNCKMIHFRKLK